jgi:hypothetical protein
VKPRTNNYQTPAQYHLAFTEEHPHNIFQDISFAIRWNFTFISGRCRLILALQYQRLSFSP